MSGRRSASDPHDRSRRLGTRDSSASFVSNTVVFVVAVVPSHRDHPSPDGVEVRPQNGRRRVVVSLTEHFGSDPVVPSQSGPGPTVRRI